MRDDSKTNIQITRATRNALADLGSKDMSFDDIVSSLLHQRNMLMIHSLCRGQNLEDCDLKEKCESVFQIIGFRTVPPFSNGEGFEEWDSFESALNWAVEMGCDEDMIGNCRENPPLGEVVTNVYCLMNDIPSPTANPTGDMRNPFSP